MEGYPNEFKQVLLNLINNAKDAYMLRSVSREQCPVVIAINRFDNQYQMEVLDHAGGIQGNLLENLFETYVSTKGEEGTGIGLSLARTIMERMGGTIRAENHPGGARFVLTLPLP